MKYKFSRESMNVISYKFSHKAIGCEAIFLFSMLSPLMSPPLNLRTVNTKENRLLKWDKVFGEGMVGYRIYRRVQRGNFARINKSLISPETDSYIYRNVKEETTCFYALTTLSVSGVESEKSARVSLKYKKEKERKDAK